VLQPGLERRLIKVYNSQNQLVESVHVWRLDQRRFRLDVAFDARPKTLQSWQELTKAAIVMNGGYFSIENERYFPNGLTVVGGDVRGSSFQGYGGMLAINDEGAKVRWLVDKPYQPGEKLDAALQAFPILVKPGGQLGFGPEREDQKRARRTVIGQDKRGRILLIVAPEGYFTLHQLSVYLTESDLDLDVALNLDGGGSTGILIANPREVIPAKPLLPFVILAYPR
jgi:exopolysaccharide biosynthesis protein